MFPSRQELGQTAADARQIVIAQVHDLRGGHVADAELLVEPRRVRVELGGGHGRAVGAASALADRARAAGADAFAVEQPDDQLRRFRIRRDPSARPVAGEVGEIPSLGDEPVKPASMPQLGLDGVVRQVMLGKERGVRALLPRDAAIGPDTGDDVSAVVSLGDLDQQAGRGVPPSR